MTGEMMNIDAVCLKTTHLTNWNADYEMMNSWDCCSPCE